MITFSDNYRSQQVEIMDNIDFQGREMKNLLHDLKAVNKWLGGNSISIDALEKLLASHPKNNKIIIMDVGCGDGEFLRQCANYGKKNNFDFECIGIDFNKNIVNLAKEMSTAYTNIKFEKVDVFNEENLLPKCDIALCTLFLHHFGNREIENLLNILLEKSNIGIVVNDLHRNRTAFNLFKIVCTLFLKTKTAAHDGLVSIARGFKKKELEAISKKIPNQQSTIHWHWAFRYQWILKKTI